MRDKRIAIGMEGSGTRAVALKLLELNGITTSQTTHLSIGGQEAAEGLVKRELDAAFFVASPSASFIKMLLKEKGMEVMSFERAEAYTRVFHFLSRVKLPEGVVDFQKNIPSRDVFLLAATANLVTRRDFHPALIDLLLQTADEIHGSGGLLEKPGEFPSPKYLEFQLSKDARRYYKSGPPFLQRYLPFWAATLIDRLKVMLLPVVALLFPLFRIMPPIYRWRVRSRIYRWYSELQDVDPKLKEKELVKQIDQSLTELNRIEEEVAKVSIPLSYAEELYELRLHIEMVREKLLELKNKRKI